MSLIIHRIAASFTLCADLVVSMFAAVGFSPLYSWFATPALSWFSSAALVAIVTTTIAAIYYDRNLKLIKKTADRTVTVEAQKLLLEINKVLVSDPSLFGIYEEGDELRGLIETHATTLSNNDTAKAPKSTGKDLELGGKLVALGCMMLNVFEIVFAQLPEGAEHVIWRAYFDDTLSRCPVIRDLLELEEANRIYHRNMMVAYNVWLDKNPQFRTAKSKTPGGSAAATSREKA